MPGETLMSRGSERAELRAPSGVATRPALRVSTPAHARREGLRLGTRSYIPLMLKPTF